MTLQDSMALIQEKRPEANPIPAFMSQLQEYEKTCMNLGVFQHSKLKRDSVERNHKPEQKRRAPIGPSAMPKKQRVIGPAAAMPSRTETTDQKEGKQVVCGPELPKDGGASGATITGADEIKNDERQGVARSQLVGDKQKDEGGTAMIGPCLPSRH